MRKSIDTYIQSIARGDEQVIRENYMTVADYIINDAEYCTGYYEYFDDDELDETGEPSEAQIEELIGINDSPSVERLRTPWLHPRLGSSSHRLLPVVLFGRLL